MIGGKGDTMRQTTQIGGACLMTQVEDTTGWREAPDDAVGSTRTMAQVGGKCPTMQVWRYMPDYAVGRHAPNDANRKYASNNAVGKYAPDDAV